MNRKIPLIFIITGSLLLLAWFFVAPTQKVTAQCATASSCKTCHEVQKQNPVSDKDPWHQQHASFDFCVACHGGSRTAQDKNAAHAGMIKSLKDMPGLCKNCHEADLEKRFTPYAQAKNISGIDFTAVKAITPPGGGGGTSSSSSNTGTQAAATQPQKPLYSNKLGNGLAFVILIILLLGGGSYIYWNENKKRQYKRNHSQAGENVLNEDEEDGDEETSFGGWVLNFLTQENWSAYAAGVLLGLTGILAVLLGNHLLGASGSIAKLTSNLYTWLAPAQAKSGMYFRFIVPSGFDWEVVLLIGIAFGGMLGAYTSGTLRFQWNEDPDWVKVFGPSKLKRFILGFLGAIIIQYGAGIAGGCTSGLAISGGMLLAPAAFLFIASMFVSGIITALIIYGRRY